ncbi:MAG: hypothetical protein NC177_09835 [Ruminococcus flavefaciens]|nr:hypothetical protein [Ruminococcus flavefaciens]
MKSTERPFSEEQNNILQKMLSEIRKPEIRAVSFRMKDTLTVTPFSAVSDMFMLMEDDYRKISRSGKNFAQVRIEAQDTAVKKSGNASLENIYKILVKNAKIKSPQSLMECECGLIKKFSSARKCGKILYDEALKNKKKIIIVSDGIYPENVISDILEKCVYNDYTLIISDDFSEIQKKSGVAPSELLHIGGNIEKDVETAILNGSKALLLSPEVPIMVKSGRLRGFIQSEKLLDIDNPEYLALRCAFGLYAMYGFDVPQNKSLKSDFCKDPYMLGFIVFGTLSLIDNYKPQTDFQREIISSLEKNQKVIKGMNDFKDLFEEYFGEYNIKCNGCELPLVFLENHSAPADRNLLRSCISDGTYKKWSESVTEPEIAPVYARTVKKNALSRLADKLFPPGTKVRTIADGILAKSHR